MNFFDKWVSNTVKESFEQNPDQQPAESKILLHTSLQENIQQIKETLGNSTDITIRVVRIGKSAEQLMGIIYTDGLADQKTITDFIMESVMLDAKGTRLDKEIQSSPDIIQIIKDSVLTIADVKDVDDYKTLYHSVLSGETVILVDGHSEGLIASSTRSWQDRGVTEPLAESVVRGPRESFSETLRTNTSLIRRKIKDPNLWLETMQIGRVTQTDVAIMYINGIVSDEIVTEVRARLNRIDIDGILESGYIEELIQDDTFTPFPTVYNTERPDVIAAELLEGKVAILIDGTPLFSSFRLCSFRSFILQRIITSGQMLVVLCGFSVILVLFCITWSILICRYYNVSSSDASHIDVYKYCCTTGRCSIPCLRGSNANGIGI